jgi:hypothetical protein
MKILTVRELNVEEKNVHDGIGLALVVNSEDGTESVLDYLYPMRGYCFQIGGLAANGKSFGSSVIGFGNVIKPIIESKTMSRTRSSIYSSNLKLISDDGENSIVHELLNGQALIAMTNMISRYNRDKRYQEELGNDCLILDSAIGNCERKWNSEAKDFIHTTWSRFIDYVVRDTLEDIK